MNEATEGMIEHAGHAVFLSHAHADREQAERLWRALELWGVPVWKDDRELRAGDGLDPAVKAAIAGARAFLLLGTPASLESEYVDREIGWALQVEERSEGTFQVIPVRAGVGKKALERAFGREGERLYADATHGVGDAVPEILRALGSLPTVGGDPGPRPEPPPRDELVLRFRKARWETGGGKRRAAADLEIVHRPHGAAEGKTDGLVFESPLGPIEIERLRWYLELYPLWTFGRELVNAREVEEKLPEWGSALYDATLGHAEGAVERLLTADRERRVVVEVLDGGEEAAASALLGLPWELLARGQPRGGAGTGADDGYLFSGARAVRVVRRLPRDRAMEPPPLARTLRVLLVVSRPDDAGHIDARESLTPLAGALATLGDKVDLNVLPDATLPALREALKAAREARRPYQVVHFDGHGVYDPDQGLGLLVFEHPEDAGKVERRKDLVGAADLGEVLAEERVPLFVRRPARPPRRRGRPSPAWRRACSGPGWGASSPCPTRCWWKPPGASSRRSTQRSRRPSPARQGAGSGGRDRRGEAREQPARWGMKEHVELLREHGLPQACLRSESRHPERARAVTGGREEAI